MLLLWEKKRAYSERKFANHEQAQQEIKYVELYYDRMKSHFSFVYLSPSEYEVEIYPISDSNVPTKL